MYHEDPSSYIPTVPSAGAAEGELNGDSGDLAKHDLYRLDGQGGGPGYL